MHELSISESILEITLRHARQAQAKKITDLYLVVGQLSSVVDDSVQFYWDFVSQGTEAEGARLHFRRIPAELECQACGERFEWSGEDLLCPKCSQANVRVISGEEFYLESLLAE
jgi:hydrogenase nickel incorporation protein HypA/HybF